MTRSRPVVEIVREIAELRRRDAELLTELEDAVRPPSPVEGSARPLRELRSDARPMKISETDRAAAREALRRRGIAR